METRPGVQRFPVRLRKGDQLPEGAILLAPEQVLEIHRKQLRNWKPWYEAWSFNIGHVVNGTCSAFTGMFIVTHYRNVLKLRNFAFPSTMFVGAVLPSLMASIGYRLMVSDKILKSETTTAFEMETKAGILQLAIGGLYPFILAPLVCIIQAQNFNTYAVPTLQDKKEFMVLIKKTLPLKRVITPILAFQFSLGVFLAQQQWSFFENKLTSRDAIKARREPNTSEDITFN